MTTETLERTEVQTLAAAVAGEIRERGHYQYGCGHSGACVMLNSHIKGGNALVLARALGFPGGDTEAIFRWNDNTPTADVLARLDAIANGESA